MIICDEFIVLNFPRTGSTFVREVIKDLFANRYTQSPILKLVHRLKLQKAPYKELLLPNYHSPNTMTRNGKGQHGTYCQIPKKYLDRDIVSVIRNPFDIFLSTYKMAWWQKYYPIEKNILEQRYPNFPNLSINEYIDLIKLSADDKTGLEIGTHTIHFIRMFFKDPDTILSKLSEDYINSNVLFKKDIASNITFLRQENLNEELADYLSMHGFTKEEVSFVREHEPINVSKRKSETSEAIWTKEAIQFVLERERFLFSMLKNLGFVYEQPLIVA